MTQITRLITGVLKAESKLQGCGCLTVNGKAMLTATKVEWFGEEENSGTGYLNQHEAASMSSVHLHHDQ